MYIILIKGIGFKKILMKELHSEAECDITNLVDITFRKTQVLRKNIIKYTPHLNDILQLHQFLIYI